MTHCTVPGAFFARAFRDLQLLSKEPRPVPGFILDDCAIKGPVILGFPGGDAKLRNTNIRVDFSTVCMENLDVMNVAFKERFSIRQSNISGRTSFQHVEFHAPFELENTTVSSADLNYVLFKKVASLAGTRLRALSVNTCTFDAVSIFRSVDFGLPVISSVQPKIDFRHNTFSGKADFSRVQVASGTSVYFTDDIWNSTAFWSRARLFGKMLFREEKFHDSVFFDETNAGYDPSGEMQFRETRFLGRLYMTGSRIQSMDFSRRPVGSEQESSSPVVFAQPVLFTSGRFGRVNLSETECSAFVDMRNVEFDVELDLEDAVLEDRLDLRGATINSVFIAGAKLNKGALLTWELIENRVRSRNPTRLADSYQVLEDIFNSSGEREAKNNAFYEKKKLSRSNSIRSLVSWAFWGYGVKPARILIFWLIPAFGIFCVLYYQAVRRVIPGAGAAAWWRRSKVAAKFAWLTSSRITYGYKHAVGGFYKAVAIANATTVKVLVFLLLYSLTLTYPLLRELVVWLWPF